HARWPRGRQASRASLPSGLPEPRSNSGTYVPADAATAAPIDCKVLPTGREGTNLMKNRHWIIAPLLGLAPVACASPDDPTSAAPPSAGVAASASSGWSGAGGTGGGMNTGGGGAGGGTATPTFVAKLDPMKGELPEGLFVDKSEAYVGLAALGKIIKIDLPGGM